MDEFSVPLLAQVISRAFARAFGLAPSVPARGSGEKPPLTRSTSTKPKGHIAIGASAAGTTAAPGPRSAGPTRDRPRTHGPSRRGHLRHRRPRHPLRHEEGRPPDERVHPVHRHLVPLRQEVAQLVLELGKGTDVVDLPCSYGAAMGSARTRLPRLTRTVRQGTFRHTVQTVSSTRSLPSSTSPTIRSRRARRGGRPRAAPSRPGSCGGSGRRGRGAARRRPSPPRRSRWRQVMATTYQPLRVLPTDVAPHPRGGLYSGPLS